MAKLPAPGLGAVGVERLLRLFRDVHHLGGRELHPEGEFVLRDSRPRLGVAEFFLLDLVQVLHRVEPEAPHVAVHSRGIGEIQHGLTLAAALHALKDARQKAAAPASLPARGLHARGNQHHEPGQVLRLAAEAIARPRPETRPPLPREAGIQKQFGGRVVELIRLHRLDDGEFIRDLTERLDRVRHPDAGPAVLPERLRRPHELGHARSKREPLPLQELIRAVLAAVLDQFRLVIEQIELRRRSRHVEIDDPLGGPREVRRSRCERVVGRDRRRISAHHSPELRQRETTQTERGALEEVAAGGVLETFD